MQQLTQLKTPRGAQIDVGYQFPGTDQSGFQGGEAERHPILVIAPGAKYSMEFPIIKELAAAAILKGFAVFCFNWAYHSKDPQNGEASEDLVDELEDMRTVIEFARNQTVTDPMRMVLAGKSLGSIVAYGISKKYPEASGLALLTPVFTQSFDEGGEVLPTPVSIAEDSYPGLLDDNQSILIAAGDADPLCYLPLLYDYLKDSEGNIRTVILPGEHGWNLGAFNDPTFIAINSENVRNGCNLVAHWLKTMLDR